MPKEGNAEEEKGPETYRGAGNRKIIIITEVWKGLKKAKKCDHRTWACFHPHGSLGGVLGSRRELLFAADRGVTAGMAGVRLPGR